MKQNIEKALSVSNEALNASKAISNINIKDVTNFDPKQAGEEKELHREIISNYLSKKLLPAIMAGFAAADLDEIKHYYKSLGKKLKKFFSIEMGKKEYEQQKNVLKNSPEDFVNKVDLSFGTLDDVLKKGTLKNKIQEEDGRLGGFWFDYCKGPDQKMLDDIINFKTEMKDAIEKEIKENGSFGLFLTIEYNGQRYSEGLKKLRSYKNKEAESPEIKNSMVSNTLSIVTDGFSKEKDRIQEYQNTADGAAGFIHETFKSIADIKTNICMGYKGITDGVGGHPATMFFISFTLLAKKDNSTNGELLPIPEVMFYGVKRSKTHPNSIKQIQKLKEDGIIKEKKEDENIKEVFNHIIKNCKEKKYTKEVLKKIEEEYLKLQAL